MPTPTREALEADWKEVTEGIAQMERAVGVITPGSCAHRWRDLIRWALDEGLPLADKYIALVDKYDRAADQILQLRSDTPIDDQVRDSRERLIAAMGEKP